MQLKTQCQDFKIDVPGCPLQLNVKVGIGVGRISILHVGGIFNRLEYVPTGDALTQSFKAEHHADASKQDEQVIMSPEAYALVKDKFKVTFNKNDGYAYLQGATQTVKKTSLQHIMRQLLTGVDQAYVQSRVNRYEPAAVRHYVETFEEKWAAETRDLTVLFVNLGLTEEDMKDLSSKKDLKRVHNIISTVQKAVYFYEGSINKFLMDDKGSTLIAVFGLPPLAHEDDPLRGLFSAMQICTELKNLEGLYPSVGVTTGAAFCGIIGNRLRREYSILGDCVNLSARLMSHAAGMGGGVVCDGASWHHAQHDLSFHPLGKIQVKGKSKLIKIFHPYGKDFIPCFQKQDEKGHGRTTAKSVSRRFSLSNVGLIRSLNTGVLNPRSWLNSGMDTSKSKLRTNTHAIANFSKRQFEPPVFHEILRQAERHERAAKAGKGSVLLVQGEVGLGKTRLCARIHEMMANQISCFYSKAHGFNVGTALSSFKPMITRMLDPADTDDEKVQTRKVLQVLKSAKIPVEMAGVLSVVMGRDFFPESKTVKAMSNKHKMLMCIKVFKAIIVAHCKKNKATVLMLDDAIFLDEESWLLLLELTEIVSSIRLILIVTTRPIIKTYCATYAKDPSDWCKKLRETAEFRLLQPLPDEVIYRIICQSMRVNDCPPELAHFIIQEARGNPIAIQDFVFILEEKEKLFTIETGEVILKKNIDWEKLSKNVRCPRGVRLLMARQLDRISHKAQMILKIAALIGERFQFWLIKEVYPLSDTKDLWKEFKHCESENMIAIDPACTGWSRKSAEERQDPQQVDYMFTNRLMRNLLCKREVMDQINIHLKAINGTRLKFIHDIAKNARDTHTITAQLKANITMNGEKLGPQCTYICGNGLYIFKTEQEWSTADRNTEFIYIDLSACTVHQERPNQIAIEARAWMKDGKSMEDTTQVVIESLVEGNFFPTSYIKSIKEINSSFEAVVARKQRSINLMSKKYKSMIDSKAMKDYSEKEKHARESNFRSSSIFAIRRLKAESILIANCMVYKTHRLRMFSAWKKRTCILTKVGVVMLAGHIADTINDVVSVDLLPPKTMICMQTHSCRVYTDRPSDFDALDKKFPHPLFIEALLWAKGEKLSWERRRFCLSFANSSLQHDWYMNVKKTINSFHHGEAGNSLLAGLYTGNPSPRNAGANPRFSDIAMTREIGMDSMVSGISMNSASSTPRESSDRGQLSTMSPRATTPKRPLSQTSEKTSTSRSLRATPPGVVAPSKTVEPPLLIDKSVLTEGTESEISPPEATNKIVLALDTPTDKPRNGSTFSVGNSKLLTSASELPNANK